MKKGIIYLLITFSYFITYSQNVGIGTDTPKARLHVSDSSVVFTGGSAFLPGPFGDPPITGPGARMMWYADKAAFRVGAVTNNNWNKDSIGNYSFASGFGTKAINNYSTSIGIRTIASGENSTGMGSRTTASGFSSTSMGQETTASGVYSTSMGHRTTASGQSSTSMGYLTIASGYASTATGRETNASGDFSTSIGVETSSKAYGSFATGLYNDLNDNPNPNTEDASDRIFQIGNGIETAPNNALTVLRNGNIGIGTTTPTKHLELIGQSSLTPVTLVIGNRNSFGSAAIEFVSDYDLVWPWRPGYIQSNDLGALSYTGSLEFYTNGAGFANKNGSLKGFEVRNGAAYTATGTVLSYSDVRLKNTITAFTDGLNVINKLNPVQFYYNKEAPFKTDQQQVGIIAQDLEKLAPYMIEKNKQNGYEDLRTVNSQAYTFLLINAVKEQQQQIEKQQKQIETSNDKVEKLNQQVVELKKLVEQLIKK